MNSLRTFGRRVWFHRDHVTVRHVLFWTAFGTAWMMMALPPARYLFLAMPVLVLLVLIGDADGRIPDEAWPFLMLVVMGVLMSPLNTQEGAKDVYLTLTGVCVAFLKDWPRLRLWWVMFALTTAFTFLYGIFGNFVGGVQFDFMRSISSFEGNFSFVFALLVPFAVMRKRYALALLALALAVLSLKRIAILAALIGVAFVLLGERRGRRLLSWPFMIVANMVALVIMGLYVNGVFDAAIFEITGQSANHFGQGRAVLQHAVFAALIDEPWRFILGQGGGTVYELTHVSVWMVEKTLLHSDTLKLLYEFGVFFLMAFIWAMYRSPSYGIRVGFLVMNVMLLTDNVLSYNFFIFFLLVILSAWRTDKEESV